MKIQAIRPSSAAVSDWCFWASIAAIAGVTAVLMMTLALAPVLGEGAWGVLMIVMLSGVGGAAGLFLLAIACGWGKGTVGSSR